MKSIKSDSCIYCGMTQNLRRQSHIVPRNLGAFKNQSSLHYRVCKTCEEEIGKCEEVLAKCGPEALFIANLGIKGRHKNHTSPFRRRHAGHEPIKMEIPSVKTTPIPKKPDNAKSIEKDLPSSTPKSIEGFGGYIFIVIFVVIMIIKKLNFRN